MSKENVTCPICKRGEGFSEERLSQSVTLCHCPVCREYQIPPFVPEIHGTQAPNWKLSAWVREKNERGEHPELTELSIKNLQASIPEYKPSERQLKFLQAIERKSGYPGNTVIVRPGEDFPLAYANDSHELWFYIHALTERGLIEVESKPNARLIDPLYGEQRELIITHAGWDYLDKHASDLNEKTQAFVTMSFSVKMKPVWKDAIKPAIEKAGYTAYRVDEEPHSDNIIFKIMAEIKNSRFLVADITEQNSGAYFEGGYALGLGLPVIWSVRKDDIKNVHFDTAQYNQIRWESPKDLEEGLYDYICAIIEQRSQP
jgi:nucleoside 2-deoxyribosyltransferase